MKSFCFQKGNKVYRAYAMQGRVLLIDNRGKREILTQKDFEKFI